MITREQFFAYPFPVPVEVAVPALGGAVSVRCMTAGERDAFEVANAKSEARDFRARLVAAVACGADGGPLFRAADVPALTAMPVYVLDPIVEAATRVNKLTPEDVAALEKN